MRIDLLISRRNELGLLSDTSFDSPVSAVIFDEEKFEVFLEFGQTMESLRCNIPVSFDFHAYFEDADEVLVGVTDKKMITKAQAVPIGINAAHSLRGILTLNEYERFWNRLDRAQPLHRDDFSETELACVARDLRGNQLQFAKELKRELALKAVPQAAPTIAPQISPGMQPRPPAPPGMGDMSAPPGTVPQKGEQPKTPPSGKTDGSNSDQ